MRPTTCPLLPLLEWNGTPALTDWDRDAYGPGKLAPDLQAAYSAKASRYDLTAPGAYLLYDQARMNFNRVATLYGYAMKPDTKREDAAHDITLEFMDRCLTPPSVHWLSLWRWRLWRLTCCDPYLLPYPWPSGDPTYPLLHPFMGFLRQYPLIRWVYREDRPHPEAVAEHVRWRRALGIGGPAERDWWQITGMTQAEIDAELLAATEAEDMRPTGGADDLAAIEALASRYEHREPVAVDIPADVA